MAQLFAGLHHLHSLNTAHRNVKPSTILVRPWLLYVSSVRPSDSLCISFCLLVVGNKLREIVTRFEAMLKPSIGFTVRRVLVVFARSVITPPKVNRRNLEHCEPNVGDWQWQTLGAIRAVARVWQGVEFLLFFLSRERTILAISCRQKFTTFQHNNVDRRRHVNFDDLKSQDLEIFSSFCFSWKTTPYSKIFKFLFRKFSRPHGSTLLCWNVVKKFWTGNRWNRALFTGQKKQNFVSLSNCRYCADRAKSVPGSAPNNVLTLFQISSKSIHFRRSYSRPREGHSFCS